MENTYTNAEKLLREKMNELSENVDCLDTITARVFPKIPAGVQDDEYIITDLEVVTGRSNGGRFLKWVAVAAAIVLGLFLIPKNGAVNRFFYNVGTPAEHSFRDITSAVERLSADGEHRYFDVPLSTYVQEDILVTPLFSCPFEDTGREDMNVRIFIRQHNGADTAEVYAVEYAGTYTPDSIIAAAEPTFTFTDEELEGLGVQLRDDNAEKAAGKVTDAEGLASVGTSLYVRDGKKAVPAAAEMLYGSDKNGSFYDIYVSSGDEKLELPAREKMWRRSVYSDGSSAFPNESSSRYERRELFAESGDAAQSRSGVYVFAEGNIPDYAGKQIEVSFAGSSKLSKVDSPLDIVLAQKMKVFLPDDAKGNIIVSRENEWLYEIPDSKTADKLAQLQKEIEKENKAVEDSAKREQK